MYCMPYTNNCGGRWTFPSVQNCCSGFHSLIGVPSVGLYFPYSPHLQIFAPTASLIFFSHRFWEVKFSARKIDFPMVSLTKANTCNQYIERNIDRHSLCELIFLCGLELWMGRWFCWESSHVLFLALLYFCP